MTGNVCREDKDSEAHRCLHTLTALPHRQAVRVANTHPRAQSPLQMSQHHYHAVLIPARAIHLNSNQDGCDSSLAAAPLLSWPVPAVNTRSLVLSRPQMATRCWNLPLKTSSDLNQDTWLLCVFVVPPCSPPG